MRRRRGQDGWRIGVDLGGTWVRVIARDGGGRRRTFTAASPGLHGLPALLRHCWRRWRLRRDRVQTLVVASRGLWTAAERERQRRRLRPFARVVRVMSDAEAAYLGAIGDGAGILLLAGTGSMALARDRGGRWARAGGLGPLLGDEGSAFWIGRQWLRATIGTTGFARARRAVASTDPVATIAALAPGVLASASGGSRPARGVVAQAEAALADLVVTLARQLRLRGPIPVSWAGGLLQDARFRSGVWRLARRRGLRLAPAPPRESAVRAVARLAQQLHQGHWNDVGSQRRRSGHPGRRAARR
jgi:N-acetylglucosamine kinase-like BadF-type ATPase